MALSTRFERLRTNLSALRKELLPKSLSNASYLPLWHTRATAYRVLAHAEVESYLEDRAEELLLASLRNWRSNATVSRVLLALLAFSQREVQSPPDTLQAPLNKAAKWPDLIELGNKIDACARMYHRVIKTNHGVKEPNLLALLLPLGFPTSALDPALLNQMNTFGSARGQAAHSARIQTAVDPKTEYHAVENILVLLAVIDTQFDALF